MSYICMFPIVKKNYAKYVLSFANVEPFLDPISGEKMFGLGYTHDVFNDKTGILGHAIIQLSKLSQLNDCRKFLFLSLKTTYVYPKPNIWLSRSDVWLCIRPC